MTTLYHNVAQNRRVRFADDVADHLVAQGFRDETGEAAAGSIWLADRPVGDGQGRFVGLAVEVEDRALDALEACRVDGDALEDLGVRVYAVPAAFVNTRPRARHYPRDGEVVE